jgi:hypothetical protein
MAGLILKAPYYKPEQINEEGQSRGGYVEYIAKREGVEILRSGMASYIGERRGSHGLFSDEGVTINLSAVIQEIEEHPGNIWGFIISLKREDAERLGYNCAEQWLNLLRSRRNDIAKEMGIAPGNFRWVAAYHNKEINPHVHMLAWSSRPQEPYLSRAGIQHIKQTLAGDIFRQELISIYKKQTAARDDVKERYRERIKELVGEIKNGNHALSPELIMKMQLLSERLQKVKGKKVYGYLDKNTKTLIKEIVKMLGNDETISELYDSWYGYKCETVRTYTDELPKKIPIEENEEFKSLRNVVARCAAAPGKLGEPPDRDIDSDYSVLKDKADDFRYLYAEANAGDDPFAYYRLGRYYLEKTDDMEQAEYWLRMAADQGNALAAYLVYKSYLNGKFTETPSDKMKYLRMAADAGLGYAEYEYAKYLQDKSPVDSKKYLRSAAEHGCFQAAYMLGKRLFDEGNREEAKEWFQRSAQSDAWTQTRVGLLLYYEYDDHETGREFLHTAADNRYVPAEAALKAIQNHLNAQLLVGVYDLFYYAGNLIDEHTEDMYDKDQLINGRGIDRKQKKEIREKKQSMGLKGL